MPPGHSLESLYERPFHIYDREFYSVIGKEPTLTVVATSASDPIFHEAPVYFPGTDEMFFSQNAGVPAAGTGLKKSSIIQKVSLKDCEAVKGERVAQNLVAVHKVDSNPQIQNPNGATNFRGNLLFTAEGRGDNLAPSLTLMNPNPPYNTTVLLDNFFGRQFNSVNDLAIHPTTRDIYFTDPLYGYWQDFRPAPGLRKSVWRFNAVTGHVAAVADEMDAPNGIAFSPDGKYLYVSDTGAAHINYGWDSERPASIYRYTVEKDGQLSGRMLFAYTDAMIPDGVHVDIKGNVYAGSGDGVQVWNPTGKLIGKIWTGMLTANFQVRLGPPDPGYAPLTFSVCWKSHDPPVRDQALLRYPGSQGC